MKRFVQFTLTYAVLMFIGNLLYDPEYGNFFFLLLTAFGLLYNLAITFWTDTLSKEYKLLSGGFIGAFSCFIIFNGGIITLIYLKDFDFISANRLGRFLNYEMLVKYNNVVALANIFYWFGYRSKFGDKIFTAYHKGLKFDRFLKLDVGVKFPKILIVFGLLVNTILLFNGAFGRGVAEAESFSGPLRILVTFSSYFEKIAMVGYFMLALYYFKTGKQKLWFYTSAVLLVIFALLSGARGPIIFLFLLTTLSYYYIRKRITKAIIIGGVICISVAFTVAAEIKRFTQFASSGVEFSEYAETFIEFREQSDAELNRVIYESLYYNIVVRLTTVAPGAIAVDYIDNNNLTPEDPDFMGELSVVPLSVFVPRSFVFGGNFPSWGNWFRVEILGFSTTYRSNTSFGSIAFFYFAGGWWFVALGFFFYGVALKFCNRILHLNSTFSFLIYLALLSTIGYLSASIPTAIISFIRYAIFVPPLLYFIIREINRRDIRWA